MTIHTVFPPSRFIAFEVVFSILFVVLSRDSSSFVFTHITIEGVQCKKSQAISSPAAPLVAPCPLQCTMQPSLSQFDCRSQSKYGLGPPITHSKKRNLANVTSGGCLNMKECAPHDSCGSSCAEHTKRTSTRSRLTKTLATKLVRATVRNARGHVE